MPYTWFSRLPCAEMPENVPVNGIEWPSIHEFALGQTAALWFMGHGIRWKSFLLSPTLSKFFL